MAYNGFEIDMISLGNADSILLTRWLEGYPMRILIDGGGKSSYEKVSNFLLGRDISRIDFVVASHIHNDHIGGLIDLVSDHRFTFGHAWLQIPSNHVDIQAVYRVLKEHSGKDRADSFKMSLDYLNDLQTALGKRGVPISEPFKGEFIGFIKVLGPSVEFYEALLKYYSNSWDFRIKSLEYSITGLSLSQDDDDSTASLLNNPTTSPENECSVISSTIFNNRSFILTADAGVLAQKDVLSNYPGLDPYWMQIPHHGSRRNITKDLIETYSPDLAFVSAKGSKKHPRRAVVNAFKDEGTAVYSTHYPKSTNLWHHEGDVPDRSDYSSATPLYEADD